MERSDNIRNGTLSLLALALVFLGVLAAYAPAMQGRFLWDDASLVQQNPFVRSPVLIGEAFRHRLVQEHLSHYYRPAQTVSYLVDYALWGLQPWGYHLSNIIYHTLCAWLLFLLLRGVLPAMLGSCASTARWIALAVALLWAVHPVHNAAVAYISGRADSLAFIFATLAWMCHRRAEKCGAAWHLPALLLWTLGLCSKEITLVWMALFASWLWFFRRDAKTPWRMAATGTLVFSLSVALFLRSLPDEPLEGERAATTESAYDRAMLVTRAMGDYARLTVWPSTLMMDRTLRTPGVALTLNPAKDPLAWLSCLGAAFAVVLGAAWLWHGPLQTVRRFAVAWFVLGFLPVSNFFPLNADAAEHWIYMPSAGLLLLGVVIFSKWKCALVSVCLVAWTGFIFRTRDRAADWTSPETLFRATLVSGSESPRMKLNLAAALMERREFTEAEMLLRETLAQHPEYHNARVALGRLLASTGRKEEARRYLAAAPGSVEKNMQRYTYTWRGPANLALEYAQDNRVEDGLNITTELLKHFPDTWPVISLHSDLLSHVRGKAEAATFLKHYVERTRWNAEAQNKLGKLLLAAGDLPGARECFEQAARLDIRDPEPLLELTVLAVREKQMAAALEFCKRAVRRAPDSKDARLTLADLLNRMGRQKEALEVLGNDAPKPDAG